MSNNSGKTEYGYTSVSCNGIRENLYEVPMWKICSENNYGYFDYYGHTHQDDVTIDRKGKLHIGAATSEIEELVSIFA